MVRVIAYDIANPRRLKRVANACLDYGARVEKSVFECDLPDGRFAELWLKLQRLIDEDEDALVVYSLCKRCETGILTAGVAIRPEKIYAYVF